VSFSRYISSRRCIAPNGWRLTDAEWAWKTYTKTLLGRQYEAHIAVERTAVPVVGHISERVMMFLDAHE
jgi:hypothetical protein